MASGYSPLHGHGNVWPCSPPMQTGQNMPICKPKYLRLNKKSPGHAMLATLANCGPKHAYLQAKMSTIKKKFVSKKKKFLKWQQKLFFNIGVLPHTKKLSPFILQGWRALSKFQAPIETGEQTIMIVGT